MSGYKEANRINKPNENDFRPMGKTEICSYPSCRNKVIRYGEAFVSWDGVAFSRHDVERHLSPMAKLDSIANPSDYVKKYDQYTFNFYLHPECAAEWGMHLIANALEADGKVGNILRGERKK